MEALSIKNNDAVTTARLAELAGAEGPCVTIYLPTHLFGDDYSQGPTRLRDLACAAYERLQLAGVDPETAEQLLVPVDQLVADRVFWTHLSAGLVVFVAPDAFSVLRLPVEVEEQIAVGDRFWLGQLVPMVSHDEIFYVLSITRSRVHLWQADLHSMRDVDLGELDHEINKLPIQRERQLQQHSTGSTTQFHGQGSGGEVEKGDLEKFLRLVADAVDERLAHLPDGPLVIASVSYYVPIFRDLSKYPSVVDGAVAGSPERLSLDELHSAALALAGPLFEKRIERLANRYADAKGTGTTSVDVDEIAERAREGRVDVLFVAPPDGLVDAAIDRAITGALLTGARVVSAPPSLAADAQPLAALLRY